jgi:NAD(P)-dependent dehydrogenase (short-subunit alcohol dehydrogenase family)
VVVTGAGSGIGLAMVRAFLAEGATVVAGDLRVGDVPAEAVRVRTDVTDEADVAQLLAAATATGRVDVVCNNAGIGSTHDVVETSLAEWEQVFAVNARGTFLVTRAAVPTMLAQRRGVIVNTASAAALKGLRDRAAYSASKGAVLALTRQVAAQYAGDGIRCVSISPGTVGSPWVDRLLAEAPDPEQRRRELVARQPMGRLANPEEIAAAAVYLASDDAAFVTGTNLVIDGGFLA